MLASDSRLSPILARARGWLPPALLILALSTLFVFGGDRGYFNRLYPHNENSFKNLALAENLSPSDSFRLFWEKRISEDGSPYYDMYSRFPIGGTALIKLAIAPFDGISARMAAARTLALLMFCGAAAFAYLAVARLASSRWVALAAALISFSSSYALYYSDSVSNEISMDIFGVMLTFHGMTIFVQDGRFRQLLIKACAALLVGWHVYALILAFIVFGLARETAAWTRGRLARSDGRIMWKIHNNPEGDEFDAPPLIALVRSRYMILGAATLIFGIAVLGANLVNEYYAYGGETPPAELPSLRSALARTSLAKNSGRILKWRGFAERQFDRAGVAALPYALPWKRGFQTPHPTATAGVVLGILAVGAALAGTALARRRALWATLALFGFFWALLARGNALDHDYEALFYAGVPLALFGTALMGARRLWGERAPAIAALAAVIVFAVSAFQMGNLDRDAEKAETEKAVMADFDVIREKTRGEVIEVDFFYTTRRFRAAYYLAGSVFADTDGGAQPKYAERVKYSVRHKDDEVWGASLTPRNSVAFLYEYEPPRLPPSEFRRVESANDPAARADFDLYLDGGRLYYVKERCDSDDTRARFFLSVHPVNLADLPERRRELGHHSLNFDFSPRGIMYEGKCAIRRQLPYYPIAAVSTGQYAPDEGEIWSAEIKIQPNAEAVARYESLYQAAKSSGEPLIRSDFDVYMDAHALTYLKEPCAESDARGVFFLDVHPVKPEDLPENRRERGFDDLAFDFSRHGVIFGGKCMARREIPGYAIAEISTGMRAPDSGEIWSAKINLPLSAEFIAYYESVYREAKSGEPIIRSDFDVYIEGDTLTYLKTPCAENDARGRFLLSVHPVNIADIPEDRRELGHASLNFDFAPSGIIFANKCMVSLDLPDYPIEKIATGQWIPGGERLWTGEAAIGD